MDYFNFRNVTEQNFVALQIKTFRELRKSIKICGHGISCKVRHQIVYINQLLTFKQ